VAGAEIYVDGDDDDDEERRAKTKEWGNGSEEASEKAKER
jgi:hypothetical protein